MTPRTSRRLSVSTWSLHHTLGAPPITGPQIEIVAPNDWPVGALSLLEVGTQIAERGLFTLEICHFHLPSQEASFLAELRAALGEIEVELWSLLVDAGDLNGVHAERDEKWIARWLEIAAQLGARNARVIAGQGAPIPENFGKSVSALRRLSRHADSLGVRLMTENWFDTLSTPEAVQQLFVALDGEVDLCLDFGNWDNRPSKYEDLAKIARFATSCHARANFLAPGQLDETDFRRCLQLTLDANFLGPYTLIPSGPHRGEWDALEKAAKVAREFCEPPSSPKHRA